LQLYLQAPGLGTYLQGQGLRVIPGETDRHRVSTSCEFGFNLGFADLPAVDENLCPVGSGLDIDA
jgi:hypothetical protein